MSAEPRVQFGGAKIPVASEPIAGQHPLACVALHGLGVNVPEQLGCLFAANQRFKCVPQLVRSSRRSPSGQGFRLILSFSSCAWVRGFGTE